MDGDQSPGNEGNWSVLSIDEEEDGMIEVSFLVHFNECFNLILLITIIM